MAGQPCSSGCSCKRHIPGFNGIPGRGRSCEQGCTCLRHNSPKLYGRTHWRRGKTGFPAWGNGLPGSIPWNKGLTKESDSRVAKYARGIQQHIETCDGSCGSPSCGNRENPSQLQWLAYDLLLKDFDVVIPEERFGKYSVDFLLAEEWLAIEVDGSYWHRVNKTNYKARDKYLLKRFGLPVVRLSEEELRKLVAATTKEASDDCNARR